jgi:3'-phosphoadenosine 5'-phosphosulfate sulfotransferase (PAPS reductase)/FAD synthetase
MKDSTAVEKKTIISLSGGKDSTAMLHLFLESGEPIADVVFFDTGWEFPQMYDHLEEIERKTGITITRLKPEKPFSYWLLDRPVIARKGPMKGQVHRLGHGWPSPTRRWCTRIKVNAIEKYISKYENPVVCIGYAYEEMHRIKFNSKYPKRYPLIEQQITEEGALEYCQNLGYRWGGVYDHFKRMSCYCCPLQRIGELKELRRYFPELWAQMMEWDSQIGPHNRGFMGYQTVHDLDQRFEREEICERQQNKFCYAEDD